MLSLPRISFSDAAPGANSNTYPLFNTVTAFGGATMALAGGALRFQLSLKNAAAGTLKWYRSSDRGTTWHQVDFEIMAASASTFAWRRDWDIAPYADWKLEWVNGGSSQASMWDVDMCLTDVFNGPSAYHILPESRNQWAYITTATTTLIKTGAGFLKRIVINKPVASQVISLYDAVTATNGFGVITFPAALLNSGPAVADYELAFNVGLTIVTATGTPDITVVYR